jgi:hypothetical protein
VYSSQTLPFCFQFPDRAAPVPPDISLPRTSHDMRIFQMQHHPAQPFIGRTMPSVKVRASTILSEFEQAQSDLVGKAVILTDGKAGTV